MYKVTEEQIEDQVALVCGYPADKNPAGSMWQANGKLQGPENEDNPFLFYQLSTYGGQSGCPILMNLMGAVRTVGIHVAGSNYLNTNFGVRINDEVYEQVGQWINS